MSNEDDKTVERAIETIAKQIIGIVEKKYFPFDVTFPSVISNVKNNKYIILDESGVERLVPSAIPMLLLSTGKHVWVTIPKNDISKMYISGLI